MLARAALLGLLLLLPSLAAAAEPSAIRLVGQQPPNLLDVWTGPWGAKVVLDARVELVRAGALYVKLVPAPEDRNHAYRNGTVAQEGGADQGWVHRVRLLEAGGAPVTRDAQGAPVASDLGATTGEKPLGPVRLAQGTYRVQSALVVPPLPAGAGPLQVQVRYHLALTAAEQAGGGGGGVQDPAVAAEWNLVVRPRAALDGETPPAPAQPAPPEPPALAQGSEANLTALLEAEAREASDAGLVLVVAALGAVALAQRRRR